ncbi:PAAR domain-containing protein [Xenorhabdus aichiensis]|uniref:PAAR domain-containing protein n=1 Tax=Xenorhabdus aichiensis TaxID=3025874 RepID=UPI00278C447D|nr:PAAR domain-containing protein [Xenorhabdus aichiensis]
MAIGHFLAVGDKTSCGGVVLTGTSNITFYGRNAAIEGSFVTCGKHSGNFSIMGGVNCFFDMGTKLAGTLDSQSTCPCRANLINSIPDSYQNEAHFSGKTEPLELQSETKKWIGFSVSPEIDYCGIKCLVTLDDGSVLNGEFNQQNKVMFTSITGHKCVKLEIENFEKESSSQSLTEILLSKIIG